MGRIAITSGDTAGSSRRAATHYGVRTSEKKALAEHNTVNGQVVLETTFDYANLPTYGLDGLIPRIPAYAKIVSCLLMVTTPFAGGTSYAVGIYSPAGAVVDADGLITDAAAVLANIDAKGDRLVGGGALVGTVLAAEGQVVVAATGTFTAGEATLRVVYEPLTDHVV